MKQIIEDFCRGVYDALPYDMKLKYSISKLEEIIGGVFIPLIHKLILIFFVMILSTYASFKFHMNNKFGLLFMEFLLWCVWIKETIDWTEYTKFKKDIRKR